MFLVCGDCTHTLSNPSLERMLTKSAGTVHFDCGGPFDFRITDDSMPTHTAEIIIEASIQRVFEALTKPELIKLWQYGRVVTTDWTVGAASNSQVNGKGVHKR